MRDAGSFYLNYLKECQRSITVRTLVAEYLNVQSNLGRSAVHLRDLKNRYSVFCGTFGESHVRTLTPKAIETWLFSLKLSAQSVNNFRSLVGGLLSYGVKHSYLDKNPVENIEKMKVVTSCPEILTPDELARLLDNAATGVLPLVAIGAFAGVRTAELMRLNWADVDFAQVFSMSRPKNSKTARRRLIKMEPCLIAWLSPFADMRGPIFTGKNLFRYLNVMGHVIKAAGLAKWPKNGLRHSFASYHLAKYGDAARLALDLGHTTTKLIFSNYRELVRPDEGERYFKSFRPIGLRT